MTKEESDVIAAAQRLSAELREYDSNREPRIVDQAAVLSAQIALSTAVGAYEASHRLCAPCSRYLWVEDENRHIWLEDTDRFSVRVSWRT